MSRQSRSCLVRRAARFGGVSPQHRGMKQCESNHDKSATALPDPGVDDVSLVKPLTCTEQFGKRGHVPPLAKRCSTFAFGSYPWPLARDVERAFRRRNIP